ncbi:MAG: hypothetical protein WKG07_09155 [Hymenobacter sp.]
MRYPTAVAVAADGTTYVADAGSHCVVRMAPGELPTPRQPGPRLPLRRGCSPRWHPIRGRRGPRAGQRRSIPAAAGRKLRGNGHGPTPPRRPGR